MAGPQNNFNSSQQLMTIYSPEGEALEATRPNAIDLVRTSGYSWKREDAGKSQSENDGPSDPTADVVIIYDEDGNEVQATKNNAREMVSRGTHTWTTNAISEEDAAKAVMEAAEKVAVAEAANKPPAPELEPENESLVDEATRITGSDDVAKYLQGFAPEALKQIASERYGETIHHRASKDTAIAKIMELEEARQLAE